MSNRDAFLTMIAHAEGTAGRGNDGYNVIVGGKLFTDYSDHPRVRVWFTRLGIWSTAAGRYQILKRQFDAYKKLMGLRDFSPASQDAIALQMLKEQRALPYIDSGNLDGAVAACNNIWASLPGNNYRQRQVKMAALEKFFTDAGGVLAAKEPLNVFTA